MRLGPRRSAWRWVALVLSSVALGCSDDAGPTIGVGGASPDGGQGGSAASMPGAGGATATGGSAGTAAFGGRAGVAGGAAVGGAAGFNSAGGASGAGGASTGGSGGSSGAGTGGAGTGGSGGNMCPGPTPQADPNGLCPWKCEQKSRNCPCLQWNESLRPCQPTCVAACTGSCCRLVEGVDPEAICVCEEMPEQDCVDTFIDNYCSVIVPGATTCARVSACPPP